MEAVLGLALGLVIGWVLPRRAKAAPAPDEEATRRAQAVLRDWQALLRYDGYDREDQ